MKKLLEIIELIFVFCFGFGIVVSMMEKVKGKRGWVEEHKPYGFYERRVKRLLDFGVSLFALLALWPVMLITALAVRVKLGKTVLFTQERTGLGGRIFTIRKYRSMLDGDGSDEERLTSFGRKLRSSSIDELPELWNILRGDMSIVGPRPQLVRDMVFMSKEHRKRHDVRPGLTGLAQVSGRNGISWEDRLDKDLEYIQKITFLDDLKIVLQTVKKVIIKEGINEDGQVTAMDYGDWLLVNHQVNLEEYLKKRAYAENLILKQEGQA